ARGGGAGGTGKNAADQPGQKTPGPHPGGEGPLFPAVERPGFLLTFYFWGGGGLFVGGREAAGGGLEMDADPPVELVAVLEGALDVDARVAAQRVELLGTERDVEIENLVGLEELIALLGRLLGADRRRSEESQRDDESERRQADHRSTPGS